MNAEPSSIPATLPAAASLAAVSMAVPAAFALYHGRSDVKTQQKSIVATSTMTLFYLGYCLIIWRRWGHVDIADPLLRHVGTGIGVALVVSGAVLNIVGRLKLSHYWANQIKVYSDQQLLTDGIFGVVRHPLYASTMLMLLGGALVYGNVLAALATAAVFIPFMYHRARQEETLLGAEFPQYVAYRRRTGMFFPGIWR